MPPDTCHATQADLAPMALTLAKAFHDDPIKHYLCGGRSMPLERTTPFFDAFLRIMLPHGEVHTAPGHEAVSIWAPPGHWKIGVSQIMRYSPRFLRMYRWRMLPNLVVLTDLEKLHATEPHYYLEFIGTDPAHQGKGFGRALMEPMIERADTEGVGMYLENSKEKNLAFYGRYGFQVRQEMQHRRNGPRMWLMWRDPR
ncbi:MAG: GNAT family N-acetyltransferase [Actinomycetota bacterium]|nr:GNAT family N-acetyltransferase [Actinomycetota bacterium]